MSLDTEKIEELITMRELFPHSGHIKRTEAQRRKGILTAREYILLLDYGNYHQP